MNGPEPSECRAFADGLPDLLYGALAVPLAERLRGHAGGCERCRLELDAIEGALRSLDRLPVLEPRPQARLAALNRVRADHRRRQARAAYGQALVFSIGASALVAALFRLSVPLRQWLGTTRLGAAWLERSLDLAPWLGTCLAPLAFFVCASLLVVLASPVLIANRTRHRSAEPWLMPPAPA